MDIEIMTMLPKIIFWEFPNGDQVPLGNIEGSSYQAFLNVIEPSKIKFECIAQSPTQFKVRRILNNNPEIEKFLRRIYPNHYSEKDDFLYWDFDTNVTNVKVVASEQRDRKVIDADLLGQEILFEKTHPDLQSILIEQGFDQKFGSIHIPSPIDYLKLYRQKEWVYSLNMANKIVAEFDAEESKQEKAAETAKKMGKTPRKEWSNLYRFYWLWEFLRRSEKFQTDCQSLFKTIEEDIFESVWSFGIKKIEEELFCPKASITKDFCFVWGLFGVSKSSAVFFTEYDKSFSELLAGLIYLKIKPNFEEINARKPFKKEVRQINYSAQIN